MASELLEVSDMEPNKINEEEEKISRELNLSEKDVKMLQIEFKVFISFQTS